MDLAQNLAASEAFAFPAVNAGKLAWGEFFLREAGSQDAALNILLDTARQFDWENGTEFLHYTWQNIVEETLRAWREPVRYFAMCNDSSVRLAQAGKGWCEELIRSGSVCSCCRRLLPGVQFEEVILRGHPGNYALNSVNGAVVASDLKRMGIPVGQGFVDRAQITISISGWIVRQDLMMLLGDLGTAQAVPIFFTNNERLAGFQFVMADQLLVRGKSNTGDMRRGGKAEIMGVCPDCGEVKYWPGHQADEYILWQSLSNERPIYQLWRGGLALREDVYQRIVTGQFPGLRFYELPIRDEPEDGLPADLKPYLTSEEQESIGEILWRDADKDERNDRGGQFLPWKVRRNLINPKSRPAGSSEGFFEK